jgi:hypothetical protein
MVISTDRTETPSRSQPHCWLHWVAIPQSTEPKRTVNQIDTRVCLCGAELRRPVAGPTSAQLFTGLFGALPQFRGLR